MRARLAVLAALAASFAAWPAPGLAASVITTGTITGTALAVTTSSAPTFSASLDGGDAAPAYSVALTTQDTRGTGAGWNET